MHYAPTTETLVGERETIWTFLGTDRLAPPILEHNPDMVLHGHAHAGTFEGRLGEVPVYNVSVPVMGEDFWVFELAGERRRVPSEVPLGLRRVLQVRLDALGDVGAAVGGRVGVVAGAQVDAVFGGRGVVTGDAPLGALVRVLGLGRDALFSYLGPLALVLGFHGPGPTHHSFRATSRGARAGRR